MKYFSAMNDTSSIDRVIFLLSLGTLATFLPLFLTAPKNIFGSLLLIALAVKFFVLRQPMKIEAARIGLFALLLFLTALILSSSLSSMPAYSFNMVYKHYTVSFLMALGFLISIRSKKDLETIIIVLAGMTIIADLHYLYQASVTHHTWNITSKSFQIDRNYSYVIPLLLPFLLGSWFLAPRLRWKVIISLGILLTVLLALLTGRRAGYFSVGMEVIIFLFFYLRLLAGKVSGRRIALISLAALLIGSGLIALASNTKQFQAAIERGLSPNGRDVIISDRLPVLSGHFLIGAGYGKEIYNNLLEYNKVPHRLGRKENGRFNYNDDEGTYIQILFRNGIAGFLAFLLFLFYPLYRLFRHKADLNPAYLVLWSVGVLTLEQYILRGLVETFILSNLIPFFAIFLRADRLNQATPDPDK